MFLDSKYLSHEKGNDIKGRLSYGKKIRQFLSWKKFDQARVEFFKIA